MEELVKSWLQQIYPNAEGVVKLDTGENEKQVDLQVTHENGEVEYIEVTEFNHIDTDQTVYGEKLREVNKACAGFQPTEQEIQHIQELAQVLRICP